MLMSLNGSVFESHAADKCALFCSDVFRLTLEWARLIDPARGNKQ